MDGSRNPVTARSGGGWDDRLRKLAPQSQHRIIRPRKALGFSKTFVADGFMCFISNHTCINCVDSWFPAMVLGHRRTKSSRRIGRARSHRESDRIIAPMKHVVRDSVIPSHIAPDGGLRVVLKEHMVPTRKVNRAVWVVHPGALVVDGIEDGADPEPAVMPVLTHSGEPMLKLPRERKPRSMQRMLP